MTLTLQRLRFAVEVGLEDEGAGGEARAQVVVGHAVLDMSPHAARGSQALEGELVDDEQGQRVAAQRRLDERRSLPVQLHREDGARVTEERRRRGTENSLDKERAGGPVRRRPLLDAQHREARGARAEENGHEVHVMAEAADQDLARGVEGARVEGEVDVGAEEPPFMAAAVTQKVETGAGGSAHETR